MNFDQSAITALTQEERLLPAVSGMSGCGLWRIVPDSKVEMEKWTADKVRLVAIQHRWNAKRHYILGTWVSYAIGLIWKEYPSLREGMMLSLPKGY